MIFLNGRTALRRTKEPRYFESVGGIYLGMGKDEVLRLYGQPSSTSSRHRFTTWKYNKQKFDVEFEFDIVCSITIYKGGNRRFDWSRLSVNDSIADFEYKYNHKYDKTTFGIYVGHREVIKIKDNEISLKVCAPGIAYY